MPLVAMNYVTRLDELSHFFLYVMSLVSMSHVTFLNESC